MDLSWDPIKDEEHKEKRGVGFNYVCQILNKDHVVQVVEEYPDQERVIGELDGKFWTLVTELHEDELGTLLWCSNFWESTKKEREDYVRGIANQIS